MAHLWLLPRVTKIVGWCGFSNEFCAEYWYFCLVLYFLSLFFLITGIALFFLLFHIFVLWFATVIRFTVSFEFRWTRISFFHYFSIITETLDNKFARWRFDSKFPGSSADWVSLTWGQTNKLNSLFVTDDTVSVIFILPPIPLPLGILLNSELTGLTFKFQVTPASHDFKQSNYKPISSIFNLFLDFCFSRLFGRIIIRKVVRTNVRTLWRLYAVLSFKQNQCRYCYACVCSLFMDYSSNSLQFVNRFYWFPTSKIKWKTINFHSFLLYSPK